MINKKYVRYIHTNNGGFAWLDDEQWKNLKDAGWVLDELGLFDCCWGAIRYDVTLQTAIDEWERVTGECATDIFCSCCDQPHMFTEVDESGAPIAWGPKTTQFVKR